METKEWWKSKTLWASVAAIVGAVGGILTGEMDPVEGAKLIVEAAMVAFLRLGIGNLE